MEQVLVSAGRTDTNLGVVNDELAPVWRSPAEVGNGDCRLQTGVSGE